MADEDGVGVNIEKLWHTIFVELRDVVRRHRLGRWAAAILPIDTCHRSRVRILRLFGWKLGHGTILAATPRLLGSGALHRRLTVGRGVYVNVGAVWELGAEIEIGDSVHIGQGVSLLTTTHEVGLAACRAGALVRGPITIGSGTWIAAGAIVLAGVTIGDGSIIAANCLVRNDVPDNCVFGGVPGRVIWTLDDKLPSVVEVHLVDTAELAGGRSARPWRTASPRWPPSGALLSRASRANPLRGRGTAP